MVIKLDHRTDLFYLTFFPAGTAFMSFKSFLQYGQIQSFLQAEKLAFLHLGQIFFESYDLNISFISYFCWCFLKIDHRS